MVENYCKDKIWLILQKAMFGDGKNNVWGQKAMFGDRKSNVWG
jgi:hypothetical protein